MQALQAEPRGGWRIAGHTPYARELSCALEGDLLMAIDVLLGEWKTSFGLPPFGAVEDDDFIPAIDHALSSHRAEITAIETDLAQPDFANTIDALELSGSQLSEICGMFFNLAGADTNPKRQEIEQTLAPKLSAHQSAIMTSKALFTRVDDLWERRQELSLSPEQARVLERYHKNFVRAGAQLSGEPLERLNEIKQRLATLASKFGQNVLKAEQDWHLELSNDADFEGLPDWLVEAAAAAARDKQLDGHVITTARSLIEPFLQYSSRRDLREQAYSAWAGRGEAAGSDNRPLVAEILSLRQEMAKILGFAHFAEFKLDDVMAKTPGAVRDLLMNVWEPARARALVERDELAEQAKADGYNHTIAPWDWRFFAERLRKARFELDEAATKPYLPLNSVIAAAFDCASKLFGLSFKERTDLDLYHPDVRAFEVFNSSGSHVGLFLGDYFARPSKRSGAWMSAFRSQEKLRGDIRPIIVNVMNFAGGNPSLLTFDDARTLFHEFGHGLHGLLSDVTYPSISGTSVARDFVELPSQLYEHWLEQKPVLAAFARHYQTGEAMPDKLIDKLLAARNFNQGFSAVEFIGSALIDLELHEAVASGTVECVEAVEAAMVKAIDMPDEIGMRHRIPHFQHIFAGGYAAGYYSYLWSEVMDADAFGAFKEAGNIFDAATASRLHDAIYSAGGRQDPNDAYVAFRGRKPGIDALLTKRGLSRAA